MSRKQGAALYQCDVFTCALAVQYYVTIMPGYLVSCLGVERPPSGGALRPCQISLDSYRHVPIVFPFSLYSFSETAIWSSELVANCASDIR